MRLTMCLPTWSGHAAPGDAAYRLVQLFRAQVEARAFFMLIAPARRNARDFRFEIPASFEGPLWRLMRQRPMNLLASEYADWDAFLLEALLASERLPARVPRPRLLQLGQSERGTGDPSAVGGPAAVCPRFLDMPTVTVAGGRSDMPRIQGPDYGASERFSVAPGHEDRGLFSHARRTKRPPALAVLSRRLRRLGGRRSDAVSARTRGPCAHPGAVIRAPAATATAAAATAARISRRAHPRSPCLRCTPDSPDRPPECP